MAVAHCGVRGLEPLDRIAHVGLENMTRTHQKEVRRFKRTRLQIHSLRSRSRRAKLLSESEGEIGEMMQMRTWQFVPALVLILSTIRP